MMIELTKKVDRVPMLINSDKIICVRERLNVHVYIEMSNGTTITVMQSFDEVKKRLGLNITPRAETIALK